MTSDANNAELFAQLDVPIADLSESARNALESEPVDEVVYAASNGQIEQPLPAAASESHEPLFPPIG